MKRALALALLALAAACGGGSAVPVGSADEMPVLQAGEWGTAHRGGRLRIGALNAKPLAGLDATRTYLSPGPQQVDLEVLLCPAQDRRCPPIATLSVRFEAKPRRTYTARVDEQGQASKVFRVWVVDDIGAIVAPGKP